MAERKAEAVGIAAEGAGRARDRAVSGSEEGAMETRVEEIRQIAITVSDVGKVLPFYRDILGLKFLFSPAPHLAFLAAGDVRIMLSTPQGAGAPGANSVLYFRVEEIVSAHAALVKRGATGERSPQRVARLEDHELWIGSLRDPDGNLVGLLEEKRHDPQLSRRDASRNGSLR